ncbi:hypothetical protein [Pontibacillus salipaludis]|uniref:Uncharacterized protein n=1 Tax=Pontibacillus salipaludis TaxID=1697394 RepID=A0ABQ1Q4Q1_9BACI|nr:hypothetical protein [Pontibacillus salipaludis]GGD12510.1 hypothetical protein GCM10011389_20090 [Pontibacillus salipaludis]
MEFLKKLNIILAIVSVSLAIYHFFIENLSLPDSAVFFYLSVVLLLNGIQNIKEGHYGWGGYLQIVAAVTCSAAAITDFL